MQELKMRKALRMEAEIAQNLALISPSTIV